MFETADEPGQDPVQQVAAYFPGYVLDPEVDSADELKAALADSGADTRRICGDVSTSEPVEFIEGWRNAVAVQVFRPIRDAFESLNRGEEFPEVPAYDVSVWKIGPSAYRGALPWATIHRAPLPVRPEPGVQESDAAYRDRLWQQWIQPLAEIERDVLDQLMPLLEPVNRTTGTDVLACVDRQIVLARDLGETPRIEVITDGIDVDPTFTDVDLTEAHLTLALHCDASDPHPEQCPQTRSDWEDTLDRLHAPDPRVIDAVVLPDQLTDSDRAEIVTPGFSALTRPQFDELLSEVPT